MDRPGAGLLPRALALVMRVGALPPGRPTAPSRPGGWAPTEAATGHIACRSPAPGRSPPSGKRWRHTLLATLSLSFGLAQAQDLDVSRLWLNAGFYSAHFDRSKNLRNANPGLGLEYRVSTDWSLTAGRFTNSDNARSNYLGVYWQPWQFAGACWGVVGGLFNGYPKAFDGGWFPALIPVATWERGHLGLNVALVPPMQDRLYGALSFQLKVRFSSGS